MLYFIVEPNNTVLYWIAIEIVPKLHVYQQQRTAVIINICMVLKQQISPTLENTYPPTNTHWARHHLRTR